MSDLNDRTIPAECPQCGSDFKVLELPGCIGHPHPFHNAMPGNYGNMISREGTGADAGGQADPLVQEPNK